MHFGHGGKIHSAILIIRNTRVLKLFGIIKNMKNKFYALWLSLVCILIFIIQVSIPEFTDLFILNQQSYIQPYRFITAIFLHGSTIHLIYNLFALVFFGLILEKFIGSKNFLIVFFISGILANVLSVNFYTSALGASGAIFGIIGALTIKKPLMTVFAFSLPMPLFLASLIWAAGDVLGFFYASDNIANLAHLSGLGFGLIFGLIFKNQEKQKTQQSSRFELPERQIKIWESRYMR